MSIVKIKKERRDIMVNAEIFQETAVQENYRAIMEFAPEVVEGKYDFARFQAGDPSMWITFQSLYAYENQYTLTLHYMEENGLTVCDTDMNLLIDKEKREVKAMNLSQHPDTHYEVQEGEENLPLQIELNNFLSEWLANIKQQGYNPIEARLSLDESEDLTDSMVYFNSEKRPFNLAYLYESSGITVFNRLEHNNDNSMQEIARVYPNNSIKYNINDIPATAIKIIEEKSKENSPFFDIDDNKDSQKYYSAEDNAEPVG